MNYRKAIKLFMFKKEQILQAQKHPDYIWGSYYDEVVGKLIDK